MIERTKYIPPIISLAGGLIASLAAIINKYSSLETMVVVLITLIVFYIIGSIIRYVANKVFYIPEPEKETESENKEESGENKGDSEYEGKSQNVEKETIEE